MKLNATMLFKYIETRVWAGTNFSLRVRPTSDRVVPEPDSNYNILSEPDLSPTESMSQLFILMTHVRTFFYE